jgi:N-acylneuraminate cytidylyltransferase/CMP-N,N'-diacetyllegionaminic acid synthase
MNAKSKKVLAIISARGGSKRIPDKNIRNFSGKPLIAYTILQAKDCGFIDRVIVDTDSPKIAEVARKFGAETPWLRPKELAQDKSKVVDSVLYNLRRLKDAENYQPDYVIVLSVTSPLREKEDIIDCWAMMQNTNASTVLTICPTHPKFYYLDKKQNIILVNGSEKKSPNTQSWRPGYLLNNFLYIVKTSSLIKEKTIITKNTKAVICPHWRSVDVDTTEDWALAECIYENRQKVVKKIKQINGKK